MPTHIDAAATSDTAVGALSRGGWLTIIAMYLMGLVLSGLLSAYSVWTWKIAVCLTMLNALLSALLVWFGLGALRVERARQLAGTLWVPLVWNALMLSQLPYLGFFFIPLEVLVAVLVLRKRVHISSWTAAVLLAAGIRLTSMALTYAAKPVVTSLFPWPG